MRLIQLLERKSPYSDTRVRTQKTGKLMTHPPSSATLAWLPAPEKAQITVIRDSGYLDT